MNWSGESQFICSSQDCNSTWVVILFWRDALFNLPMCVKNPKSCVAVFWNIHHPSMIIKAVRPCLKKRKKKLILYLWEKNKFKPHYFNYYFREEKKHISQATRCHYKICCYATNLSLWPWDIIYVLYEKITMSSSRPTTQQVYVPSCTHKPALKGIIIKPANLHGACCVPNTVLQE